MEVRSVMTSEPPYTSLNDIDNFTHGESISDAALRQMNNDMYDAVLPITVFVGIEAVLGFFGNAVVLYVFLLRYKPCNFRYFVLCLAFIDILSTLTTIPGEVVTQVNWYIYPNRHLCKAKSFFNVFTVSGEALCLLTIAVDRYRKVCHPHHWQIHPRLAKRLCFANYCVAFVVALPVAFLWGIREQTQKYRYNGTDVDVLTTICEKDKHFQNTGWPLGYSVSVQVIVSVCLLSMFCLYVFVARRLLKNTMLKRRASRMQATMNNSASAGSLTYSEQGEFETAKASEPPSNDKMTETEPSLLRSCQWSGNDEARQPRPHSDQSNSVADSEHGADDQGVQNRTSSVRVSNNSISKSHDSNGDGDDHDENDASLSEIETKVDDIADNSASEVKSPTSVTFSPDIRRRHRRDINSRVRRKTLIMFILTVIFILTTATYLTLLSFIARTDDILQQMSDSERACYFFFFRLVFINHVINPIVYGLLDPQFRNSMKNFKLSKMCKRSKST